MHIQQCQCNKCDTSFNNRKRGQNDKMIEKQNILKNVR